MLDALAASGIPEKNANGEKLIIGISQGFKLNGTIKTSRPCKVTGRTIRPVRRPSPQRSLF